MYRSALSATGSFTVTRPDFRRPVKATPVTPGLLAVLQPPPGSWVLFRNVAAFRATLSHVFRSGPPANPAAAIPIPTNKPTSAFMILVSNGDPLFHRT